GQHDREILFLDRGCDDGNGGRGLWVRSAGAVRKMLPPEVTPGGHPNHYEADDQRPASPAFRDGFIGSNRWCGHRISFPTGNVTQRTRKYTIFEKKEGVTVGRRSKHARSKQLRFCFNDLVHNWGVGSKLDADLQ